MVTFLIREDVVDELIAKGIIEKSTISRNIAHLTQKIITDKNGHRRKVWVKLRNELKAKQRVKKNEKFDVQKKHKTMDINARVSFEYGGNTLEGTITSKGTEGLTIKDDKNNLYKVKYNNINSVIRSKDINVLLDKSFVQQGFRNGSDGLQPKSFDTIEGLYKGVESVQQEFLDLSKSVAERFKELKPNLLTRKTLKGEDRIKEKLREDAKELKEEGGNPALLYDEKTDTYHCRTIRDCDGHTLCLNSLEDVSKVMQFYNNQDYVVQMKNKFAKPSPVGYSDINMNIKLSNGAIVEMQLNTTANMVAKERYGHSLYEVFRSIESNPKYKELADLMGDAQKKLYGLANKYSKDGNYPEVPNGNIFDENYKHEPYANSIRDYVQKSLPLFEQAKKEGMLNKKNNRTF